jgi:aminoglycoside phosphotransferase (APT) family kinase protein
VRATRTRGRSTNGSTARRPKRTGSPTRSASRWTHALDAPWDGAPSWFHGDVARGNLLLRDGELAAVLDFGTCGVGDPSCDLAVAWTLLTADGRRAFRERLAVDAATWARGRGWALWKTLVTCSYAPDDAEALRALDDIFAEYQGKG